MKWEEQIPGSEITESVTEATVDFAKRFGKHLGADDKVQDGNRTRMVREKLTTNQLRRFFGEVKRQQMRGYKPTDFILLKPKLAYAVGRSKGKDPKIKDFYMVIINAIDKVKTEAHFRNFIKVFEAIVAYHKASEEGKLDNN